MGDDLPLWAMRAVLVPPLRDPAECSKERTSSPSVFLPSLTFLPSFLSLFLSTSLSKDDCLDQVRALLLV